MRKWRGRSQFFFSPKEAQLLFRQLQKLSAPNIAALRYESWKTKCWVPWYPLMQLSILVRNFHMWKRYSQTSADKLHSAGRWQLNNTVPYQFAWPFLFWLLNRLFDDLAQWYNIIQNCKFQTKHCNLEVTTLYLQLNTKQAQDLGNYAWSITRKTWYVTTLA